MFTARDLKPSIVVTEREVECPVKGCSVRVERQRERFKRATKYLCSDHGIYISPSTFEYVSKFENLLWNIDPEDRMLLEATEGSKRENRMARDNSEDAVTWNVFRFFEKADALGRLLSSLCDTKITRPEAIYWSYSHVDRGCWPLLRKARAEFGEHSDRGTEPDLIVLAPEALIWIEAKVGASNRTTPTEPANQKKYVTGANRWFDNVFTNDYQTIAVQAQFYELCRMYLLGTWAAAQLERPFVLVNLVLDGREPQIEKSFGCFLRLNPGQRFRRWTWQQIRQFVSLESPESPEQRLLAEYFSEKTLGYDENRHLRLAFRE